MGKGRYSGRRVDAFVFDLDGTLVDSELDIALAANFTRLHFGLPELPVPTVTGYVGDGVARLLHRTLGHDNHRIPAGSPVPEPMHAEGMQVFADHYGRHLLDNTRLYPGVLEVLRRFAAFPLAVATNKPRAFTDAILTGLHIDGAFRRVVAGDEVPARKPDPAHLAAALEGLEVAPEKVAMVGDSPNDILAAKAYGALAVGCTYGLVSPGRVRSARPDLVIDSFAELGEMFPARRE
ncbi:phosphoglycolate phosphatase [bacterium]|nr:MAG: phosphoglycolate phosphatase [bacterium]